VKSPEKRSEENQEIRKTDSLKRCPIERFSSSFKNKKAGDLFMKTPCKKPARNLKNVG
jgi:hypothetical protein